MGQPLSKILSDQQEERKKLLAEQKKIQISIAAEERIAHRMETDLERAQRTHEATVASRTSEINAHKSATEKFKIDEDKIKRRIDDIDREILAAKQGIEADEHLSGLNKK